MSPERRRYARLYARRQREAALNVARRTERTCPKRLGRNGLCGGLLEGFTQPDGTWYLRCPRCDLVNAGRCVDCGAPVVGTVRKARRCARHWILERTAASARHRREHRTAVNKQAKARARRRAANPSTYAHDLAIKKAWRLRNVGRIKMSKRKWRLNPDRPGGYSSRALHDRYHRIYNLKATARRMCAKLLAELRAP